MMADWTYLVDSDVFITAKNLYYFVRHLPRILEERASSPPGGPNLQRRQTDTPHERCGRRQSNVGDIARGLLQVGGLRPNPGEQQDRGHLNHAAIDGHGLGPPAGELGRRGASGDHGGAVGQPSAHRRRVSGGRTGRTTAAPAAAREAGGSKGKRSHPSPAPAGDPRSVAPKGRLAPVQ